MKETDGIEGVKKFSRKLRRETRTSPSTVLQLKTAVYGIPDAGQAFSMFMQGLHIKKAGMVQCEVDPTIYVKVSYSVDGKVDGFMVAITWVDDVRYFGTDRIVQQYDLSKLQMHHGRRIDRICVNQHETGSEAVRVLGQGSRKIQRIPAEMVKGKNSTIDYRRRSIVGGTNRRRDRCCGTFTFTSTTWCHTVPNCIHQTRNEVCNISTLKK